MVKLVIKLKGFVFHYGMFNPHIPSIWEESIQKPPRGPGALRRFFCGCGCGCGCWWRTFFFFKILYITQLCVTLYITCLQICGYNQFLWKSKILIKKQTAQRAWTPGRLFFFLLVLFAIVSFRFLCLDVSYFLFYFVFQIL